MIYICLFCGSKYNRRPSQQGKYCSRECFRKSMLGHVCSEETRKKIGAKNAISKKGCIPWNKGLKDYGRDRIVSKETCEKISVALKGRKLTNEHRKKLSLSHKGKPSNKKGKSLSDKTRIRISLSLGGSGDLTVHHIDYDKYNCNEQNLITLCRSCHPKTNFNRDYWKLFFRRRLNRERN